MKGNGRKVESTTSFPSAGEFLQKAKIDTFTDARNICMQIYGLLGGFFWLTVKINNFMFQVTNEFLLGRVDYICFVDRKKIVLQFTDIETIKIDCFT